MLPLALAFCALAPLALAGDPTFDEAVRLYNETEYEQAILRFEEVSVRSSLASQDRALALVWLGLSFASNSDFEGAARHFKDALRLDPGAALPPNVSPRIVEVFDRAKVEAAPPAPPNPPPPPPPADPSTGGGSLVAIGGIAVGGAALVSAAMLGVLSAAAYGRSTNDDAFADARLAAYDDAVNLGIAGGVVAGAAALLVGAGVALLVLE